jgi:hypothetical protein
LTAVLYSGGEASRIYEGQYTVVSRFTWPDGQPGEDETAPMTYEDAMNWLASAPHAPLIVSDGADFHTVRVERARIEPVLSTASR